MIFSINPLVFNPSNSQDFEVLANIFRNLADDFHILASAEWAASTHPNFKNFEKFKAQYLSPQEILNFENITLKTRTTQLLKTYLTTVPVGYEPTEIAPILAEKIIRERSRIIVENGVNDWRMLQGICEKYTSSKKRKNLYLQLKKAFQEQKIEAINAGGSGHEAIIKDLNAGILQNILKYKAMCIFDSDRNASTDKVKSGYGNLIAFIQQTPKNTSGYAYADCTYKESDLLIWHIWYKRELENYVPIDIILKRTDIKPTAKAYLENLIADSNNECLDFLNLGADFPTTPPVKLGISNDKDVFPKFFSESFSYELLETKCAHHKVTEPLFCTEEISEMELILLKIAKIV